MVFHEIMLFVRIPAFFYSLSTESDVIVITYPWMNYHLSSVVQYTLIQSIRHKKGISLFYAFSTIVLPL